MALAENSGLQPIETLSAVKSQQIKVIQIEHDDCFDYAKHLDLMLIYFYVYHGADLNSAFRIITLTLALIVMMLALMTCVSKMSLKL